MSRWTADEVAYLTAHWQTESARAIGQHLRRTRCMVVGKLHLLGLVHERHGRPCRAKPKASETPAGRRLRVGRPNYDSTYARDEAARVKAAASAAIANVLTGEEAAAFRRGLCRCGRTRLRPFAYCVDHAPDRVAA